MRKLQALTLSVAILMIGARILAMSLLGVAAATVVITEHQTANPAMNRNFESHKMAAASKVSGKSRAFLMVILNASAGKGLLMK